MRDELRQGMLVALDVPAMRTDIPITALHRRNGYLSPAAKALLDLLTAEGARPLSMIVLRRPHQKPVDNASRRRGALGIGSADSAAFA